MHTITTIFLVLLIRCTLPAKASKQTSRTFLRGADDGSVDQIILNTKMIEWEECPVATPASGEQCSVVETSVCRYGFMEVPTYTGQDGSCSSPTTCQPTKICGCHGNTWMCFPIVEEACANQDSLPSNVFQECTPEENRHVAHPVSSI